MKRIASILTAASLSLAASQHAGGFPMDGVPIVYGDPYPPYYPDTIWEPVNAPTLTYDVYIAPGKSCTNIAREVNARSSQSRVGGAYLSANDVWKQISEQLGITDDRRIPSDRVVYITLPENAGDIDDIPSSDLYNPRTK